MKDINRTTYNRTSEQYSLAILLGQEKDAGEQLIKEVEGTLPNFFAVINKLFSEIYENPSFDLTVEQQDHLFGFGRMTIAYMIKVLLDAQEDIEKDEREEQIEKQNQQGSYIVEKAVAEITKILVKNAESPEDAREKAKNNEGTAMETITRDVPPEYWNIYPNEEYEVEKDDSWSLDILNSLMEDNEGEEE